MLNVDKIQKVFILEHPDGPECLFVFGDGGDKVIWHLPLVMKDIFGNSFLEFIDRELLVIAQLNVKLTCLNSFDASQNSGMVCKTNIQKSRNWEIHIIRQLQLMNFRSIIIRQL